MQLFTQSEEEWTLMQLYSGITPRTNLNVAGQEGSGRSRSTWTNTFKDVKREAPTCSLPHRALLTPLSGWAEGLPFSHLTNLDMRRFSAPRCRAECWLNPNVRELERGLCVLAVDTWLDLRRLPGLNIPEWLNHSSLIGDLNPCDIPENGLCITNSEKSKGLSFSFSLTVWTQSLL